MHDDPMEKFLEMHCKCEQKTILYSEYVLLYCTCGYLVLSLSLEYMYNVTLVFYELSVVNCVGITWKFQTHMVVIGRTNFFESYVHCHNVLLILDVIEV